MSNSISSFLVLFDIFNPIPAKTSKHILSIESIFFYWPAGLFSYRGPLTLMRFESITC
jgi:hypothetical protein